MIATAQNLLHFDYYRLYMKGNIRFCFKLGRIPCSGWTLHLLISKTVVLRRSIVLSSFFQRRHLTGNSGAALLRAQVNPLVLLLPELFVVYTRKRLSKVFFCSHMVTMQPQHALLPAPRLIIFCLTDAYPLRKLLSALLSTEDVQG